MVVAPPDFDFTLTLSSFSEGFDTDFVGGKPNEFISRYSATHGSEADKKQVADQCLKVKLQEILVKYSDISKVISLLTFATSCARKSLCSVLTPFALISDALECSTLDDCERIFDFVEKQTSIWKSPQFYVNACKNQLLRNCNDLLRRLSQSQNNVFCGRIHIFLTRIFPISEKSALNLNSNFNLDNETDYTRIEDDETENRDLYNSLWSVQDYFRNPLQLYEPVKFAEFEKAVNTINTAFANFKLEVNDDEEEKRSKMKEIDYDSIDMEMKSNGQIVYFPKFLTSFNLLELQLNDPSFRRQILTEILFLFQYLTGYVKFRSATNVLPFASREWIRNTEKTIYELLQETPRNGKKYVLFVKHLIEREAFWVKWKNEGCPRFMREKDKDGASRPKKRKTIYDDFMSNQKLGLGSPELTKLWGSSLPNLEACKTENRQFIPKVHTFFEEAMEHADPANEIEDQYKCYKNAEFGWRSLRLLAHASPHFFSLQPANMHHLAVPKYLEHILKKLLKEVADKEPKEEAEENKTLDAEADTNEFEDEKELLKTPPQEETEAPVPDGKVTSDQIDKLSTELGEKWKDLAEELRHITSKDIKSFEEDADDDALRAKIALCAWQDKNGAEATSVVLMETLKAIGLDEIANNVFGEKMEQ